jgi:hypothetical protein
MQKEAAVHSKGLLIAQKENRDTKRIIASYLKKNEK